MKLVPGNIKCVCLEKCSNVCFNASRKHVFFYQCKPVLKDMRNEKACAY